MLIPIHRLFFSFLKASVIIAIVCSLLIIASHVVISVWLRCSGYSDEGLFLSAKECVVNKVGVNELNEEVENVFSESCREEHQAPLLYNTLSGGCLDKVYHALPSSAGWRRAMFDGRYALVLRFGCHYNYAWLIIVNPNEHLSQEDSTIRHLADNIVIIFESGRIKDIEDCEGQTLVIRSK